MQRPMLSRDRQREALDLARGSWLRSWGAIRSTPGLLLLAFLIGASLWVFVTDTENPTVVDTFPSPVPVEAVNVGTDLAVANQLPAVDVRLAAPEDRWEQITTANLRAVVDLKGLDAREQEVRVQVDTEGVSGVRVVEVIPRTVRVNLEQQVSMDVDVEVQVVGSLPVGYELTENRAELSSVTVTGPESLVELVSSAVASINVTGLTVDVEQSVPLTPQGSGGGQIRGVRLDPDSVRVSVGVRQRTLFRTLPLRIQVEGMPAPGYRVSDVSISPATLQAEGTIEALQQVDALSLPPVDITGARSDVVRVVEVNPPDGIATDRNQATVTVAVVAVSGTARLTLAPVVENVQPGRQAELDRASVDVLVQATLPVLNSLNPDDIAVTIDASGLDPGIYRVTPEVTAPRGVEVLAVQPESLSLTLSAP